MSIKFKIIIDKFVVDAEEFVKLGLSHYQKFKIMNLKKAFRLLLLLLIISCQKQAVVDSSLKSSDDFIQQAKSFFITNVKNQTIDPSSLNLRQSLEKTPDWKDAYTINLSVGKTVVVPLAYDHPLYVEGNGVRLSIDDLSHLLIYKSSGGNYKAEVITTLPDNDFVNSKDATRAFSGSVVAEDWQGHFLAGFHYDTSGVKAIVSNKSPSAERNKIEITCITTSWYTCVSMEGVNHVYCNYDGSETQCFSSSSPDYGGSGGSSPNSADYGIVGGIHGDGGGGGVTSANNTNQLVVLPANPAKTIKSPEKYFRCFTYEANATYGIDVFVQEPIAGTRYHINYKLSPGHTFLDIWEKEPNGIVIRRSVGFWPKSSTTPLNPVSDGIIQNDEGHSYNVHVGITNVSAAQIHNLISTISSNSAEQYNLSSNNCASYAIAVMSAAGIYLPKTRGRWFLGGGYNPADLGEDIHDNLTISDDYSKNVFNRDYHQSYLSSPTNSGNCDLK